MKTIEVTLMVVVPETDPPATEKEINEWVNFNTGYRASISLSNPLVEHEFNGNIEQCYVSS